MRARGCGVWYLLFRASALDLDATLPPDHLTDVALDILSRRCLGAAAYAEDLEAWKEAHAHHGSAHSFGYVLCVVVGVMGCLGSVLGVAVGGMCACTAPASPFPTPYAQCCPRVAPVLCGWGCARQHFPLRRCCWMDLAP